VITEIPKQVSNIQKVWIAVFLLYNLGEKLIAVENERIDFLLLGKDA
jgi:hypothetical protein